ncbi:hypothetical protein NKH77_06640 [Streptomyces sp. M19]
MSLLPPAKSPRDPGLSAGGTENSAACGRFDQNVLGTVRWRSAKGHWFVLAAGSRRVDRIALSGDVREEADGSTVAARADRDAAVTVRGHLDTGRTIAPPTP